MARKLLNKIFVLWLMFSGMLILAGLAQAQEAALPKEAEQAMASGLEAAKKQDWASAIKQFKEAQKLAPVSPQVLFNLALAYDKAGDKELPALALYEAYLIVAPDAANSQIVQARVKELDAQAETNIRALIKSAKEFAANFPDEALTSGLGWSGFDPSARIFITSAFFKNLYRDIAYAEADLGDPPAFGEVLAEIKKLQDGAKDYRENQATMDYSLIAKKQAWSGDVDGAMKTASLIQEKTSFGEHSRSGVYREIVRAKLKKNDLTGAKKTSTLVTTKFFSGDAKQLIAEAEAKAGKFSAALALAAKIEDDDTRVCAYTDIAKAQLGSGDKSGALQNLLKVLPTVALVKDDSYRKIDYYYSIAELQFKAGDPEAALNTLAQAEESAKKAPADNLKKYQGYWIEAEIQLKSADVEGARGLLAQAKEEAPQANRSFYIYGNIARLQNKIGDVEGAHKTIAEVAQIVRPGDVYDGGYYNYLELGRGLGDMKIAKAMYLANFASTYRIGMDDDSFLLGDWPGCQAFTQSQKENEDPKDTVEKLASVANYLARALKEIRLKDKEWQD